jgi:hypothetical protein
MGIYDGRQFCINTTDFETGEKTQSAPFYLGDPSLANVPCPPQNPYQDWSFGQQPARSALGTNPKDLVGSAKVSITKLPAIATVQGAMAMMDGAGKYGPYNWRKNRVIASIYVDAIYRHAMAWYEGQESAGDSSVHHLGHVIACAGIILDAQATGNLVDDRILAASVPGEEGNWFTNLLDHLSAVIKNKRKV